MVGGSEGRGFCRERDDTNGAPGLFTEAEFHRLQHGASGSARRASAGKNTAQDCPTKLDMDCPQLLEEGHRT